MNITKIDWQKVNSLLPVIIQNISTREVLMLGYMNEEALTKTIKERKVTFFSRTKQRLWTKGEISGNFLNVEEMSLDCDNDTLLILVDPIGATCHTGEYSCFHQFTSPQSENKKQQFANWAWFIKLEQHLKEKKNADPSNSYTATLHAKGTKKIAQKVGEEGVETALAAVAQDKAEVISEATDLVYHLTVLLHNQDLQWYEIIAKLQERHQGIGLHPEGGNK
ncbi:bifunctional phosphoribosyl-AMP cyclohydrolase/phosphoribosyl-ATP diphosphatase HisIE [Haemophilus influenzae]|uniref:bifunctional phosphoribosyl-AMP cyclohydrolase/phosphoribosyl-ATP diphosphatase HisIE n=1 Tax=Haemophilus influenzae TaxID=727 RepID=UPI000E3351FD|nr:bifunctional phosphoribosyl-AMP cyclohydrolase/phosphoribosyl-ATP diphosphatase HisIE [Haemophilus influenzae]AXP62683.1 bifunctional phosphoribosyl-AMP cyclohydrolase/phosphoribosyl-ATP diphosphatase HisIE [Haemophilus influenzae]